MSHEEKILLSLENLVVEVGLEFACSSFMFYELGLTGRLLWNWMSLKSDGRQDLPSLELHTVKSRTSRDFPEEILGDEHE